MDDQPSSNNAQKPGGGNPSPSSDHNNQSSPRDDKKPRTHNNHLHGKDHTSQKALIISTHQKQDEEDSDSGSGRSGGTTDAGLEAYKQFLQRTTGSPYSAETNIEFMKQAAEKNRFGLMDEEGTILTQEQIQQLKDKRPERYAMVERDLLDVKASSLIENQATAASTSTEDSAKTTDQSLDDDLDTDAEQSPFNHRPKG